MDPLTLIPACVGVAKFAISLITGLEDLRSRYRDAAESIDLLLSQLQSIQAAAGLIEHRLQNSPSMFNHGNTANAIRTCLRACASLMKRIQAHVDAVRPAGQAVNFSGRTRHVWSEAAITKIEEQLGRQITALNCVLNAVQINLNATTEHVLNRPDIENVLHEAEEDAATYVSEEDLDKISVVYATPSPSGHQRPTLTTPAPPRHVPSSIEPTVPRVESSGDGRNRSFIAQAFQRIRPNYSPIGFESGQHSFWGPRPRSLQLAAIAKHAPDKYLDNFEMTVWDGDTNDVSLYLKVGVKRAAARTSSRLSSFQNDRYDAVNDALLMACMNGYGDIVQLLLDHGANASHGFQTGRLNIFPSPFSDVLPTLFPSSDNTTYAATAVWIAICTGHTNLVRLLHAHGASLETRNCRMQTPLNYICNTNGVLHTEAQMAVTLLELGVDIEARGEEDKTPLFCAIERGKNDLSQEILVETLLNGSADPNAKRTCHHQRGNRTPLAQACKMRNWNLVQSLLEAGADLKARISVRDNESSSAHLKDEVISVKMWLRVNRSWETSPHATFIRTRIDSGD
ncbi:ankyrin repeat-containing domain protein [Lophiotrema nucula]|uniref:Ankyrin repeat-containing domain protein n=1 Tax=Lophiotrema nucula TaxID=690887 RepID=A0A6A5YXK5_9PLEO|nr:ankyrin repeat-containing domain protein [Lophiotrema nucula]